MARCLWPRFFGIRGLDFQIFASTFFWCVGTAISQCFGGSTASEAGKKPDEALKIGTALQAKARSDEFLSGDFRKKKHHLK